MPATVFQTSFSGSTIETAYKAAQDRYARWVSIPKPPCSVLRRSRSPFTAGKATTWADLKMPAREIGGGLAVTGNYPGKARTADELRGDAVKALSLVPGRHRFNLHAMYAETGGKRVDATSWPRSISPLDRLVQGTKAGHGLQSDLLCPSQGGRRHDAVARRRGHPQVLDRARHRLPQDRRGDRRGPRQSMRHQRLDSRRHEGLADRPRGTAAAPDRVAGRSICRALDRACNLDAVESKLFGIGSESYVVGSHEYYLGYAITRKKLLTLDTGHFHPTETIVNKLSAVFAYLDEILLHVSRGIRWDSDHVVIVNDSLLAIGGTGPRRFPRADARRLGLFRRLDQSRGRLGDRRAGDAQGTVDRALGADRALRELERCGDFTRGWPCWTS